MKVINVENLRWIAEDNSMFSCDVKFEEFGEEVLQFNAVGNSVTEHGKEIWTNAVAGNYGPIAPYSPPTPTQLAELERIQALEYYSAEEYLCLHVVNRYILGVDEDLTDVVLSEVKDYIKALKADLGSGVRRLIPRPEILKRYEREIK